MRSDEREEGSWKPRFPGLAPLLALPALLFLCPFDAVAGPETAKLVVVLHPDYDDGRLGGILFDQSIRATFAAGSRESVEIHNEYVDVSSTRDDGFKQFQAEFLRRKYAGRKVALVIAGLSFGLDFALKYREQIFPGIPIVFAAVDAREVKARKLAPDVIGVPIAIDLPATLDLALQLHPNTQRVFVIAGKAKFDAFWETEARRMFRPYQERVEFVYLTGLPMEELLKKVARLPKRSIIYYLHVLRDGAGKVLAPVEVLALLAEKANAPIYGHADSYVGRGIVGGRVISLEAEGKNAAQLGLRILAGERAENIGVQETSVNLFLFDWRQLQRWRIDEENLPPGSHIRYKQPSFWDLYWWRIIGLISLCVIETLLIVGLMVQRANRRRAEAGLRESQRELRVLTGRLLLAQETERRRIARELHDDLNQRLALLAVEMDLIGQKPPESAAQLGGRMQELSAHVRQLSSSVHDLSHQLHPSKLEQLGLVAAVRGLCKELTQGYGLSIEFTHQQVPEALPEDMALCLYRIVQEALRNVIKHSGARHVEVALSGGADAVCLRIVDDGAGFNPRMVDDQGGLGLASMRERLHLVGGAIAIDSRPSRGTRIDVRIPLGATGPAESALQGQPAGV